MKYSELSSFDLLFSKTSKIKYLNKNFDFNISSEHFIEWLKAEEQEITGKYEIDVSSMCEYSCLYISMLLYDRKLKGEMFVYSGSFGFWGHYWIGYKYENEDYFIDLTLKQFIKESPELAISKSTNNKKTYHYYPEGIIPIRDYVDEKRGFDFYTNPLTMQEPKINMKCFENKIIFPE